MVGNTKELPCINAITLDYLAIYLGHILPGLPSHRSVMIARSGKVADKSQSSALSIAYDTGQFFLGMHIYP